MISSEGNKGLPNARVVERMNNVMVSSFFPQNISPIKAIQGLRILLELEQRGTLRIILCYPNMFYILGKEARGLKRWKDCDLMLSKESCFVRVKCIKRVNRTHILVVHVFVTFPKDFQLFLLMF